MPDSFRQQSLSTAIQCDAAHAWSILRDIERWHTWDVFDEYLLPDGLNDGSHGSARIRPWPSVSVSVADTQAPMSYQLIYTLPFGQLSATRSLHQLQPNQCALKVESEFSGWWGKLYAWLLGIKWRESMPMALARFRQLCEA